MEVWGVTGLIGAGKSTALRYLLSQGYPVVDADQAARMAVDPSTAEGRGAVREIVEAFGEDVWDPITQGVSRAKLRARLTNSLDERNRLEQILHPKIRKLLETTIQSWDASLPLGFVEGSRLVESGWVHQWEGCVLVTAAESLRMQRASLRDGVSLTAIQAMGRLQDEPRLRKMCSVVWDNSRDEPFLIHQIEAFVAARLGPLKKS